MANKLETSVPVVASLITIKVFSFLIILDYLSNF